MGEVIKADTEMIQELVASTVDTSHDADEIIIIERDEVEFRVIDSMSESLERKVSQQDDSLDERVSAGSTISGENPLDVQMKYITVSESTTPYFSYDSPYDTPRQENVTVSVQSEAERVRSVTSEIMHKKVQAIAGVSHEQVYSNENQQAQMEWYKKVNTFFLMFLYDVT